MDGLLDRIEAGLNGLVEDISRYRPVDAACRKLVALDTEFVAELGVLREHYDACKKLESLRAEVARLDRGIDSTLLGLSECRKQLESSEDRAAGSSAVNTEELLNYATKITKFTRQQPGAQEILPWPTDDQLRKGMLATLAVNEQDPGIVQDEEMQAPEERPEQASATSVREVHPKRSAKKINLDLFDSDDE